MEKDPKEKAIPTAAGFEPEGAAAQDFQITRRKTVLVGLTAVPVIMSIIRTSAWATQPNCSIVASYVNDGNRFTSPSLPGHNVTIDNGDIQRCRTSL